jgi:hypothetical protein
MVNHMNLKEPKVLIIGGISLLALIVLGLFLFGATAIAGISHLFSNSPPPVPATTGSYTNTVVIDGTRYTADAAFCKKTMPVTLNAAFPGTTLELYGGACGTYLGTAPAGMTLCDNKFLQVCGLGTGIPTAAPCTDTQKVQLSGVVTISNGHILSGISNMQLGIASVTVNPPQVPKCIACSTGKLIVSIATSDPGKSDDDAVQGTQSYPVNATWFGTQTIPYSFNYEVVNADCNLNLVDDHTMKMTTELYDSNGQLLESDTFSVGQNLGKPIAAGWSN